MSGKGKRWTTPVCRKHEVAGNVIMKTERILKSKNTSKYVQVFVPCTAERNLASTRRLSRPRKSRTIFAQSVIGTGAAGMDHALACSPSRSTALEIVHRAGVLPPHRTIATEPNRSHWLLLLRKEFRELCGFCWIKYYNFNFSFRSSCWLFPSIHSVQLASRLSFSRISKGPSRRAREDINAGLL